MVKILVTGINGFVGKHLVRELAGRGVGMVGAGREESVHPEISKLLADYFVCELTDAESVKKLPLSPSRHDTDLFSRQVSAFGPKAEQFA